MRNIYISFLKNPQGIQKLRGIIFNFNEIHLIHREFQKPGAMQ